MTIPKAEQLASMVAMQAIPAGVAAAAVGQPAAPFALSPGGPPPSAAAPPRAGPATAAPPPWAGVHVSQAQLAPLTIEGLRRGFKPAKASPLDDASTSALYAVAESRKGLLPVGKGPSKVGGFLNMIWRRELGGIQKLLRWVGDTAYLISVPFLVLILFSVGVKNRPLALFGAAVVIALNIGRLVSGLLNLIVIHFRDSPIKGILFLIPPITLVFLVTGWNKMQRSIRRVVEPAITIGLVIAAFLFIPSLRKGGQEGQSLSERVKAEAGELKDDLRTEMEKAKGLDLQKIGDTAKGKLDEFQKKFRAGSGDAASPGDPGANPDAKSQPPEAGLEEKLKTVEDQIRKRANEIRKEP